nr:hypothetical protein [Tanacetum cinerariifolium]
EPDYVPGPEEPEQAPPSPVYIPYVPELEYSEYIPVEDESDPDKDPEDDDDEDPEEDPADYPTDRDDDDEEEEEPSGDNADEEDEEQDEDDDDEEEEHSALVDSIPPPPALRLLSSDRRTDRPEVTLPPRKRLSIVHRPRYEAGESSAAAIARPIKVTALGEIQALQAREQARAGTPEGAGSSTDLKKMAPKRAAPRRTTRLNLGATSDPNQAPSTTTTTITNAQL